MGAESRVECRGEAALIRQNSVRAVLVICLKPFRTVRPQRWWTCYVGRCCDVMRDRWRCGCANVCKRCTHFQVYCGHTVSPRTKCSVVFAFVGGTCTLGRRVLQLFKKNKNPERIVWTYRTCWCCHLTTGYKFASKYYPWGEFAGWIEFFFFLACYINPLNRKRRLLYLKTQFVPRSKHFISVIKTNQFML